MQSSIKSSFKTKFSHARWQNGLCGGCAAVGVLLDRCNRSRCALSCCATSLWPWDYWKTWLAAKSWASYTFLCRGRLPLFLSPPASKCRDQIRLEDLNAALIPHSTFERRALRKASKMWCMYQRLRRDLFSSIYRSWSLPLGKGLRIGMSHGSGLKLRRHDSNADLSDEPSWLTVIKRA